MLQGAIRAAIQYRKVTLFAMILMTLFGIYSYQIAPKQESPEIEVPIAVITTVYPGASPVDVELLVTSKIEDEIATVRGFDYSTSTTTEGVSIVVLRLHQEADIDKAWESLRQKMRDLQTKLPQGVEAIDINVELSDTAGFILAISGDGNDELVVHGEFIVQQLQRIAGISRIEIQGETEREIQVTVDSEQLLYLPISLRDISQRIAAQNTDIPSGSIRESDSRIQVKTPSSYGNIEDIRETIVLNSGSSILRLRDIADIELVATESSQRISHNGREALLLTGYFKDNVNIVRIGEDVDVHIQELIKKLPDHLDISYMLNQPQEVHKAVDQFVKNLLLGMLFVIAVVFIGMGLRNAIVVSAAIPLSMLMTLSMMNFLGVEIHQISIVALIISLGMLVDNAIVISDSIQVRVDHGEDKYSSCVEGVKDVALPVGTSTLTTIGAFLPLLMLPSVAGEFIRSLPLIVMVALSASYVVALLVTPTLAYIFFKKSKQKSNKSLARQAFIGLLHWSMRWKALVITTLVIAMVLAGFLAGQLGLQFFPKADKSLIYIDITAERTGDLDYTEAVALEVEEIVAGFPEVRSYTTVVGTGLPKFYHTMPISIPSQNFAQIVVDLDLTKSNHKKNTPVVELLQKEIDHRIVGGTVIVAELEQGEPIGSPVRLRVYGDDVNRLYEVANEINLLLEEIEGTTNVHNNIPKKTHQFYVDVDNTRASLSGISKHDIQRELSAALRGTEATIFRQDGKEYPVIVKSNTESLSALERIGIPSSITGNKVLLTDVATIQLQQQIPAINKYNKDISLTVYSDVRMGYSPVRIQEQLEQRLQELELQGVSITFDGEREKIDEYFGEVGYSAIFAILLIYGVLLIQFHSYGQPLMILLTIPLSAIGSIVGLYVFQQPLSFTALLGIVSLFGIVVNNAIVLLDFINQERRTNPSPENACLEAVDKRLRPILLSTITTTMGLIPLVLSGSELFRPLSISIMSGLVVSTVLTLIVIPIFYVIVENWRSQHKRPPTDKLANDEVNMPVVLD